ncbi:hypothetical protein NDU88_006653 [Pleurodeles waltl]|uniref:Uncharacterized protein n=1 Tax=Pleurodeles waltl TaxID=8319 RepID=A0AAV7TYY3_PLEWA|nr:hypothetical protein NDU88_006653 [Pleurodeles waltl]
MRSGAAGDGESDPRVLGFFLFFVWQGTGTQDMLCASAGASPTSLLIFGVVLGGAAAVERRSGSPVQRSSKQE